jgi:hypothetical protein
MRTILMISLLLAAAPLASAHCDNLDGPVVVAARRALASADVRLVLPWVGTDREAEIRAAYDRTVKVRALNAAAAELADTWFFETVVRVHRAGEGAAYDGLKPAGSPVSEGIRAADHALAGGSVEALDRGLARKLHEGLRERFRRVQELKNYPAASVEAARRYVEAYVEFVHFSDRAHNLVKPAGPHAEHAH